ncbi:MAG: HEAT repeat domain-containing protein [Polyangiaceae bacterium]|jgi:hypothetical protein
MNAEDLMAQLSSEDESIRSEAVDDIGWADMGAALGALVARLQIESSQAVREGIVAALARLTDPRVPASVAALLTHEEAAVRNAALRILQKKGRGSLDAIQRAFREGNADVRKLAIDATARWVGSEVDALYGAALVDHDLNVRMSAVESIEEHGRGAFRERLEELFRTESDPMMLSTLLSALLVVGGDSTWSAIQSRYPTLESAPPHQRALWIRAFGQWAGPSEMKLLGDGISRIPRNANAELFDAIRTLQERHPGMTVPEPLLEWLRSLSGAPELTPLGRRIREWLATALPLPDRLESVRPLATRRGE